MENSHVDGEEEIMAARPAGRKGPPFTMRFVCDAMLGKLAKYLRILGFDAVYVANTAALDRMPGA